MFSFIELPQHNAASATPAGAHVLGIEVTDTEQAALCSLGNVDGMRGDIEFGLRYDAPGYVPRGWNNRATIDIATEIPLPPDGAVLATSKATLSSIGAMAVLVLRKLCEDGATFFCAVDDARPQLDARIRAVADASTYKSPADWSPSPLPTAEQPWPTGPAWDDAPRGLAAIMAVCSALLPQEPLCDCGHARDVHQGPGDEDCISERVVSEDELVRDGKRLLDEGST